MGGLRELLLETPGLPDLKLLTETDKRHRVGDACMTLEVVAQHHPTLSIDLQRLAGPVQRQGELLALVRIRREATYQGFDLRHQRAASRIDRGPIQCRIAIETLEAIADEH